MSWQAYGVGVALNVPLLILTGGSIGAEPVAVGDMPGWAVVAAVASVATAVWVVLGDRVLFRNRREHPAPVAAVVAYHGFTGLIFTAAIWVVGPAVGVQREGTWPETAISTVAIGIWFGLTMILLLDARDRFSRRREQLLDQAVTLELTSLQEGEIADRVDVLIRDRVGEVTQDLRAEVSAALEVKEQGDGPALADADWGEIADRMRDSAETALRPLSHELWRSAAQEYPRPRWGAVLRQSLVSGSFWAAPSMAIVFIGYVRAGTYGLGVLAGVAGAVALAVVVGLVLLAANAGMSRIAGQGSGPARVAMRLVVGVAAFLVVQALGVAFTGLTSSGEATSAEVFGSVLGMAISVLAPAVVAALNTAREGVLQRLQQTTDGARARQIAQARQLAETTQQAARIIHGSLQTKLMAAAAAIDQAVATGSEDLLAEALAHVSVILEGSGASTGDATDDASVDELVARACGAWNGIMVVEVSISPRASGTRGQAAQAAGLIVEEALANAYRHGRAEAVRVDIDEGMDDAGVRVLDIAVKDDGSGIDAGTSGLGSVLILRLAEGRAVFERQPDGYLVQARVTVAH